ncbi:multidrug effflux MFS transporter [Sphingorhabdus arenilitoris]|uniref:Bcr/CflA family efflux transporter n=1 Tax=Sphingorhabdus arenilitoris TaxID=1490041 RepID=A0ABV8RBW0_9SPHN
MMASLMAINALAIDTMLPAFPNMISAFGLNDANQVQYIISSYLLGMAVGSLFYGPLSDRYGRKAVMMPTIIGYALFSFACSYAPSFEILLILRICQGLCGAAMGVLVAAVIRDQFEGDAMARRMSMIFMTFMIVPIIAPTLGALILKFAPWRVIFDMFAALGIILALWIWRRLPETLDPANVIPIQPDSIARTWKAIITNRMAMGYVLGSGMAQGALFGYLNASEQLFGETFNARDFFPIGFAIIAIGIACANFTNSRIVERFGARRVSHSAVFIFILMGLLQIIAAKIWPNSLPLFLVLITINMAMIGFIGSNFSSIAMQPFGAMAGAASSFQNMVRTMMGAVIGALIGQQFDGSVISIAIGFCVCGGMSLIFILWCERGKLFTRRRTNLEASE